MSDVDYNAVLAKSFDEIKDMVKQREELDLKLSKMYQFIRATANMLPDEGRAIVMAKIEQFTGETVGLTDAIRNTLKASPDKWLTAVDVREQLFTSGFDFSGYTSNPLASIHAVLKRMKPSEVESEDMEGVTAYRWISRFPRLSAKEERRRKVAAGRLPPGRGR